MKTWFKIFSIGLVMTIALVACGGQQAASGPQAVSYSLRTDLQDGKMVFIGVGGEIDGMVNPTLKANVGDTVNIKLTSGDGAEHNIAFPDFNVDSPHVSGQGNSIAVSFLADKGGSFVYYCNMPGHREAGMEGQFVVAGGGASASAESSPSVPSRRASDAPGRCSRCG